MSFAPGKLAVLAYANTFSLWYYDSDDEAQLLGAPGYFNEIAKLLRRGDVIFTSRICSGTRKTALLLVTRVADDSVTIDTVGTDGVGDPNNLGNVFIEDAQPQEVLTYDGGVWVNRRNPGISGDAHAAVIGNPHQTSAADVGAVSAGEKGQPGGIATLDPDGFLSPSQLRTLALANLQELIASNPEIGHVLKYDGATWVTAPEAGKSGDAFAASHPGSGGLAHAGATATDAGFMSAADKEKLDAIAALAEPNPPAASDPEATDGDGIAARTFTPAQIKLAIDTRLHRWESSVQIPNSQLAPVCSGTLKGRASPGNGDVEDLTATEARGLLNVEDGAVAAGAAGDAHALATGNPHSTTAPEIGAVSVAEKGAANGIATLGEDGKVPAVQLPPAIGGAVGSVFGRTGAIAAEAGDYAADQIADTATKVLMTSEERSKLSCIDEGASAAGVAGDLFASAHAGTGGAAHAAASSKEAGFMSAADKEKLDGIAPSAAPNPALATQEEIAAGIGSDPRLLTPALIKQAVVTHAPPAAADSVSNVALANMAAARIKGRATGAGVGDPQDLTPVQARTILNVADGATAAGAVGDSHASAIGNPHQTTAEQIGAVPAAEKGMANGIATLDAAGKVPAAQLPTTMVESDIDAGLSTTVGSVTPANLSRAVSAHEFPSFSAVVVSGQSNIVAADAHSTLSVVAGNNITLTTNPLTRALTIASSPGAAGGEPAFSRVTVGANNIDADTTTSQVSFVAGSNISLVANPATKEVTITGTTAGTPGSAFSVIGVSGQSDVVADCSADRLTFVAGGGMQITTNASGDSITFSTIQAGAGQRWWHASDPQFAGGLKTSNTAEQNRDVFTALFQAVHDNSTDNNQIEFPAGSFQLTGSISPSGRDQGWMDGSRTTLHFPKTRFNFSGSRTAFNQVKCQDTGDQIWYELDHFQPNSAAPFRWGDTVVAGGAMPLITAAGLHRKMAVLFDTTNCSTGSDAINALQVVGNLWLSGPEKQPFSTGLIGIGPGRIGYGSAKGTTWGDVTITGVSVGIFAWRFGLSSAIQEIGDGFTSASFERLVVNSSGRAFVLLSNGGDELNIKRMTISCRDTAYLMETHVVIGSAFINTQCGAEVSLAAPNPKIIEIKGGTLTISRCYLRPDVPGTRCFSAINVGKDASLFVGTLHNDMNHGSQSGAAISMCKTDKGEVSSSGTIVITGTSNDMSRCLNTCVVGVTANASAARRYVQVIANNRETIKPGGTPAVKVIPDFGSTVAGTSTTGDRFNTFGNYEGALYQTITAGALENVAFP